VPAVGDKGDEEGRLIDPSSSFAVEVGPPILTADRGPSYGPRFASGCPWLE